MRRSSPALAAAIAMLAISIAGCRPSTAPLLDPALAAGTYVLEEVTGRGPSAGSFLLTRDGQATRRVQYSLPGLAGRDFVAVGTFSLVRSDSIAFALREDEGRSEHIWRVRAAFAEHRFSIRYPDPADGPDVVESYRRTGP